MITVPQTFIFIGRSGSGKGTQAKLLVDYLSEIDPERKTFRVQLGVRVREFISGDGYTNKLSRKVSDKGDLQPGFLMTWMWASDLIENFDQDNHLIFDGMPRKKNEAVMLDAGLVDFYGREKPWVLNLDISEEVAVERLEKRGRDDDRKPGDIERRMEWFRTDVVPTLDYFRDNPRYRFLDINGEQGIENIHKDIADRLSFS